MDDMALKVDEIDGLVRISGRGEQREAGKGAGRMEAAKPGTAPLHGERLDCRRSGRTCRLLGAGAIRQRSENTQSRRHSNSLNEVAARSGHELLPNSDAAWHRPGMITCAAASHQDDGLSIVPGVVARPDRTPSFGRLSSP